MSGQIHIEDVVEYWRVGELTMAGAVCLYAYHSEAVARHHAEAASTDPDVRETWIRPVIVGGLIGQPVQYYRDGREVR